MKNTIFKVLDSLLKKKGGDFYCRIITAGQNYFPLQKYFLYFLGSGGRGGGEGTRIWLFKLYFFFICKISEKALQGTIRLNLRFFFVFVINLRLNGFFFVFLASFSAINVSRAEIFF